MIRDGLTATKDPGELERLAEAELVKRKTDESRAKETAIAPIFLNLNFCCSLIQRIYDR
jgi:hypothetical protein